ncbi:hypothetical protein KUTeg_021306 [Tegillarca granosa]|uniref:MIB/HERC2 domain-containing protein n=1 Tax=Tegillarca granosa TaxID=220873 RepID=A0ABQ9EAD4_TEGGR|nr:hypothetical protein KUTeg_021306 [Tegillarca granosa]
MIFTRLKNWKTKMAEGGLLDIHYWPKTADKEVVKGREYISSQPELQGDSSDTVLCLDISQSMKGKAFDNMIRTAKTFVYAVHNLQSYHIRPRIIVMTDGIITPSVIISGNDNQFIELEDRITIELKRATTTIQKARYIIYCIPFGASNQIRATNIKQYHCIPGEDWKSIMKQSLGDDLSEKDFDFVVSMAELATTVEGPQYKEFDTNMLPIGTRVRRGPDWKYGDQDENGVGTIISHSENKWLWVQWDHGGINIYPYNDSTGYSIVVVDEPRHLSHQKSIDVGICVGLIGNLEMKMADLGTLVYVFVKKTIWFRASSHSNTSQSDYTFEKRLLEPQSGEKSYFEFDTQPELSNEISIESKDVVHREDPDDNASETFEKCLNEDRCSNKISKMIIWKYFQSGTWKTFDSTLSDNLELKFMPMVLRNIQTSEECKVEREESTIPQEVLTMDKEWIDLYKQSLIKGKEKVHNIRVMVVGPEGVGKTVLTKRLLKHYVDITQRQSTNGIDVHIEKCGTRISDGTWEFNKDKLDKANRFENRLVNVMQQIPSNPIGDDLDDTENTITLSESPREMLADNKSPEQTILPDFHEIEAWSWKRSKQFRQ